MDAWFVDEAPDGRPRWETLPPSHPLSLAHMRRPQGAMPGPVIPPPIPRLKTPLLERSGVRATLLGLIGVSFLGFVAMSMRSTRAAEPPIAAAIAAPAPATTPVVPEQTVDIPAPQPAPVMARSLTSLPAAHPAPAAAPVKHARKHKLAKHGKRRFAKRSTASWKWAD